MFTLAHLSDPHLGPLPRPKASQLIGKRAIGFINWHRKRKAIHRAAILETLLADLKAQVPDHIAVTGDLVNIALPEEFSAARLWLDALGSPEGVTLVPGNHDAYVRAASPLIAAHLDDYMRGDDGSARVPFVRRRDHVALIGLSTAIPTLPFMATGALGRTQLERLAETLHRLGQEDVFRIVLIHHPPVSAPSRRFKRLLDGEDFRKVLAQQGAELVLHGHDHVYSLVWLDGKDMRIPAVGVPSASAITETSDDPAGYNIFRIGGSRGAWRCTMTIRGFRHGAAGIGEIGRHVLFGEQGET